MTSTALLIKAAQIGYNEALGNKSRAPAQSVDFNVLLKDNLPLVATDAVNMMQAFADGYQCQCDEEAWDIIPIGEKKPSINSLIEKITKQNEDA